MVKTCHKRISSIKQTSSQRTWPRINRRSNIGESDRWYDSRSRAAIRPAHNVRVSTAKIVYNPCLRAEVVNESRPSSTIEVENGKRQSISFRSCV